MDNDYRVKPGDILQAKWQHCHGMGDDSKFVVLKKETNDFVSIEGDLLDIDVAYEQYEVVGHSNLSQTLYAKSKV